MKNNQSQKFEKPTQHTLIYWDYIEVISYIEKKYKIKTEGYIPKCGFTEEQLNNAPGKTPYLNFWHWVIDGKNIHNGSSFDLIILDEDDDLDEDEEYRPRWVREILRMIYDEFSEAKMSMLVAW